MPRTTDPLELDAPSASERLVTGSCGRTDVASGVQAPKAQVSANCPGSASASVHCAYMLDFLAATVVTARRRLMVAIASRFHAAISRRILEILTSHLRASHSDSRLRDAHPESVAWSKMRDAHKFITISMGARRATVLCGAPSPSARRASTAPHGLMLGASFTRASHAVLDLVDVMRIARRAFG
jgi:hypothetical protein